MDITMSTCSKLTKGFILYLHRVLFCFFNVSITLDKALKNPSTCPRAHSGRCGNGLEETREQARLYVRNIEIVTNFNDRKLS